MTYAGVGSRSTSYTICGEMIKLGECLARADWILHSGGADGADTAFEQGCLMGDGIKRIFLPYKGFNKNKSPYNHVCERAMNLASTVHPAWNRCSHGARMLHGRNCYQVLGQNLDTPVDLVLYWCQDENVGGTRTALKLAERHNIPCIKVVTFEQTINRMAELGLWHTTLDGI